MVESPDETTWYSHPPANEQEIPDEVLETARAFSRVMMVEAKNDSTCCSTLNTSVGMTAEDTGGTPLL